MNDSWITTYCLENELHLHDYPEGLDVKSRRFVTHNDKFKNLKKAIQHAQSEDDDVICCICGENGVGNAHLSNIEFNVNDLVEQRVFSFYLNATCAQSVRFHDSYSVLFGLKDAHSFVITAPIFLYTLSLIDEFIKSKEDDWNLFLSLILPHNILLERLENYIPTFNRKIHIISPFRDCALYIEECWNSVNAQLATNYHIYFIDDCSRDRGIERIPDEDQISKKINSTRQYALNNILNILQKECIADDDIVCLLDADDKLSNKYVLSIINSVYNNYDIQFTYGSMQINNDFKSLCTPYSREDFKCLRKSEWKTSHLRSFRYKLFKELQTKDPNLTSLKDHQGRTLKMPYDMALFFPLMELAGYNRIKFIPSPLYCYRLHNDNDHNKNRKQQYEGEIIVRNKKPFKKM